MHIGILGGSFDPPHLGHLSIAQQVKTTFNLDAVWLVPCFQHPFAKKLSAATHRLAMTKHLTTEGIIVSDWEITQHTMSISIATLEHFTEQFGHHFSWIIGADQLPAFPTWHGWQRIIADYGLIVVPRGGNTTNLTQQTKECLHVTTLPQTLFITQDNQFIPSSLSSTSIRQKVANGESIAGMVTPEIERYIIKHNLYRHDQ